MTSSTKPATAGDVQRLLRSTHVVLRAAGHPLPVHPTIDMPWSVHVDYPHRLLVTVAWGVLADHEIAEYDAAIRRHWDLAPCLRQLIDVRGVTGSHLEASLTAGHPVASVGRSTQAAIVGQCGAQPLVGRMLAAPMYVCGGRVRVFARLPDAERWLGLPPGAGHLPADAEPRSASEHNGVAHAASAHAAVVRA